MGMAKVWLVSGLISRFSPGRVDDKACLVSHNLVLTQCDSVSENARLCYVVSSTIQSMTVLQLEVRRLLQATTSYRRHERSLSLARPEFLYSTIRTVVIVEIKNSESEGDVGLPAAS